jgi:hypothetical protein
MTKEQEKKDEQIHVEESTPYTLHVTRPGKDEQTTEIVRNLAKLQQALLSELENDSLEVQETIQVSVSLSGHPVIGEGKEAKLDTGRTVDATLPNLSGTANAVMAQLAQQVVQPEQALMMLEQFVNNLGTVSDLVGVLVTMVSESKGVGGKTIMNDKFKIGPEDIIRLAEGADGHVATFRVAMKQQGVQFPEDSAIVTPGQAGFTTPPPLKLAT